MTQVCVIEDDKDTRDVVRMLLEDEGYDVIEASDGQTGHNLLCTSLARLIVLLDHRLPRMDGCDLLDIIAHDRHLRDQHIIIFMTASPTRAEADCGDMLEELAVPLVRKPFALDELLEAVRDAERQLAMVGEIAGEEPR